MILDRSIDLILDPKSKKSRKVKQAESNERIPGELPKWVIDNVRLFDEAVKRCNEEYIRGMEIVRKAHTIGKVRKDISRS